MARIRQEEARAKSPAAFWAPLEFLASRLSLTAAVLLLALSVYLVEFAPHRIVSLALDSHRTERQRFSAAARGSREQRRSAAIPG